MPKQMIAQLAVGETVKAPFLVLEWRLMPFRSKSGQYLDLRLGDRSGAITCKLWDCAEEAANSLEQGMIAYIEGEVQDYQGKHQVVIRHLRPADPEEYDLTDLVRGSSRPREEMIHELLAVIDQVQNPHLHGLLEDIFGDPDFMERFASHPGASKLHHACVGGLLEHTLSVVGLCAQAAQRHPRINRDLLLTGALLHDLGKLEELQAEGGFDYTDAGRFCGHTVLTDRMVAAVMQERPEFPEQLMLLLTHLLLSHHGQLEWGAPVVPKTAEALALHYADNLDARVQMFEDYRDGAESGPGPWSPYNRSLERQLYLGAPEPHGEASSDQAADAAGEWSDDGTNQ